MTADEVRELADKNCEFHGHETPESEALHDYADLLARQEEMERYADSLEDRVAASRVALERERARCAPLLEALKQLRRDCRSVVGEPGYLAQHVIAAADHALAAFRAGAGQERE